MVDKLQKLEPTLGLLDATAISVGAIIGAGIFVVTGIVAGMAGPALLVSMIIAAVVSLFTALSFAELSAWLPREGSVYEFSYRLISPFAAFTAGWMYILGIPSGVRQSRLALRTTSHLSFRFSSQTISPHCFAWLSRSSTTGELDSQRT